MKVQYLGTAAAEGWPGMFCHCKNCEEARRRGGRDIRTRCQTLIDDVLFLDFPPDTYYHALQFGIDASAVKYLLFTHSHMDHMYPQELELRGGGYAHDMVAPDLEIYGSAATKASFDTIVKEELEAEIAPHLHWHILEAFQPTEVGPYRVTAFPARHMAPEAQPYVYLIEKDGKALLYLHDTGYLFEEVFEYLLKNGIHPDMVSLDCTYGPISAYGGDRDGHMGIPQNRKVKDRLIADGVCSDQTIFVINHFSHNGSALYDELCEEVRKDGFLVAFDGRIVEL